MAAKKSRASRAEPERGNGGQAPKKRATARAARGDEPAPRPGTKKRRGVKLTPTTLTPPELKLSEPPAEIAALADAIRADGGEVLAGYREPLGGHPLLFAALPVEKVGPTPFQRDVSDAHVRKLTHAMDKTRRYLDPIIVVRTEHGYETPNGGHRLTALRELGAASVLALVVPELRVAYQILALNIEKAHNLRERALEVERMMRDLSGFSRESEHHYELELEDPALVTLGFAYAKRGRLAGGAYHPALRKVDHWLDDALPQAAAERERRAELVLALDDAVTDAVKRLQASGLKSPYLKNFVVARVNPLRFIKGEPPSFDDLVSTMTRRAAGLDAGKVRAEDLARSGGAPEEEA